MEIETRAKVKDLSKIRKKLIELGAKFTRAEQQDDSYFKPKGTKMENQGPGSFITRIRKGNKITLTVKELTDRSGVWREYETEVSDLEQTKRILGKLGLVNIFDINKKREHGKIDDMAICLDDIKQLGTYLEVEIITGNPKEGKKKIAGLFKKLGIKESQIEHRGYARIISENMGIKFNNVK